jgi:hypothetical protein
MDKPSESHTASGSAELHIAPEDVDKPPLTPDTQLIAAVAANTSKNDDTQEQITAVPSNTINQDGLPVTPPETRLQSPHGENHDEIAYLLSQLKEARKVLSLPPRPPLIPPKQK